MFYSMIEEGNAFYAVDEECMREKRRRNEQKKGMLHISEYQKKSYSQKLLCLLLWCKLHM